jgi:orotidine-5'-phosphate decarboxylase
MTKKFIDLLKSNLDTKNSHVCVGLDSQYDKIPDFLRATTISQTVFNFNKNIIDQTHDLAVIYKMNVSFYAGYGAEGLEALRLTNQYLKENYPDIQTLADCKRSEMGESVKMVANELFLWLGFDCVMVTPWFGVDTLKDYYADDTKGVLVYIHDSNPSAYEIQNLELKDGRKVYEELARLVASDWNINGNLWAEAGITYLEELKKARQIIGDDMPLLVAGVGAQGGQAKDLQGLFGAGGKRLIVNSSRGIIFNSRADNAADYYADARQNALALRDELNEVEKL